MNGMEIICAHNKVVSTARSFNMTRQDDLISPANVIWYYPPKWFDIPRQDVWRLPADIIWYYPPRYFQILPAKIFSNITRQDDLILPVKKTQKQANKHVNNKRISCNICNYCVHLCWSKITHSYMSAYMSACPRTCMDMYSNASVGTWSKNI